MQIKKIIIRQLNIPFNRHFATAQFNYKATNNLIIEIETEEHISGYGESIPRTYVTGEDITGTINVIKTVFAQYLIGRKMGNIKEAETTISQLVTMAERKNGYFKGSALCALDMAIFDVMGHIYKNSVTALLGGNLTASNNTYSIGIPLINDTDLYNLLNYIMDYRVAHIKIKVGSSLEADIERIQAVRRCFGESVDIRIDANCQWNPQDAIERINIFEKFNISCVEQPVAANDIIGMAMVKKNVTPAIIADESACSYSDVQKLIELDACDIINIKLSKCGGLYNSLRISKLAKDSGKTCLLGYHIGETGLLEAAGRTLASVIPDLKYLEGFVSSVLLVENIVHQNLMFDKYGQAPALPGAGLGVTVNEAILDKYTVFKEEIN